MTYNEELQFAVNEAIQMNLSRDQAVKFVITNVKNYKVSTEDAEKIIIETKRRTNGV